MVEGPNNGCRGIVKVSFVEDYKAWTEKLSCRYRFSGEIEATSNWGWKRVRMMGEN